MRRTLRRYCRKTDDVGEVDGGLGEVLRLHFFLLFELIRHASRQHTVK